MSKSETNSKIEIKMKRSRPSVLVISSLTIGICFGFRHSDFGFAACPEEKVKVTIVVILASEEKGKIDPRLKQIAAEIQKENPNLKSFELKNMESRSLAPKEKSSFDLVEKKTAQVIVKHGADKNNKVGLSVWPPDQGEIAYSTVCGKFLPIVTRAQTKSKQRIILAIRVQPCNE